MEEQSYSNRQDEASTTSHPLSSVSERLSHWSVKRPLLLASVVFLTLMTIFFFEAITGEKTYFSPDAQAASAITRPLEKALWENGAYPLWTPYVFCGMPSFASISFTPLAYFPQVLEVLIARVLPINMWFIFSFYYVLAGMGVFVFLRRKGTGVIPALTGGFAFMMTPYLITMTVYGHGSQMMTAAYIPWAFWAVDRLIAKVSFRNVGLAGLIIGLMLQRGHVQIAYYGLMLIGLYLAWYLILSFRQLERGRALALLGGVAGALALAFALAAMLYLPVYEYTPYSIRGAASVLEANAAQPDKGVGFDYATQWSFSPGEMMTFIFPSFYGFGGPTYWGTMPFTDYPNYMGILVLLLAISAFVFYPRFGTSASSVESSLADRSLGRENRLVVSFLGFIAALSLLISFGHNFAPFYRLLYEHLPYFNKFRVPVMILILLQYAVAVLAGLGMEGIIARLMMSLSNQRAANSVEQKNACETRGAWSLVIVTGVVLVALLAVTLTRNSLFEFMRGLYPDNYPGEVQLRLDTARFRMLYADVIIAGSVVGGGLIVLALALLKKIRPAHAAAALCFLVLADLWMVDAKLGTKYPKEEVVASLMPDQISRFLQADSSLFRIYPMGELFGEMRWSAQGIQSIGGYHAAKPRFYQDFITAMGLQRRPLPELANPHIIDMMNVKYVLTLASLPDSAWIPRLQIPVNAGANVRQLTIYENPTVLPRAYLVGEYEVEPDPIAALTRMRVGSTSNGKANGFDAHRSVLLMESPEFAPQPDSAATAEILKYDLHQIEFQIRSASPQLLVLSDNYYPVGWQAYIDGRAVKTYRANYCFRAVCVPAGEHTVEFRYQSTTFKSGVWISIAALTLCLAFLFIDRPK